MHGDCRRTRAHFPKVCEGIPACRRFFRPPPPDMFRGKFCRARVPCKNGARGPCWCRQTGAIKPADSLSPPAPSMPPPEPQLGAALRITFLGDDAMRTVHDGRVDMPQMRLPRRRRV